MSAWQFAFVCSRVLAAWVGVILIQYLLQLFSSLAGFLQSESGVASQIASGLGLTAMYFVGLVFLAYFLWTKPDVFADGVVEDLEPSDNQAAMLPWEQPAAYLLGLWLVLTALPDLGGLLASLAYWHSVRGAFEPGAVPLDQYVDLSGFGSVLTQTVLGLVVMVNAKRIAKWSRANIPAQVTALRTAGVAKSPDDPAA